MTHIQPQIREASRNDSLILAALVRSAFADVAKRFGLTAANCPRHPSNCMPSWIDQGFAKGVRFFILQAGPTPYGCVGLTAPKDGACELVRLAVHPLRRRMGFGEALVAHALEQARAMGVERVELGYHAENEHLRRWYERFGFELTRVESPAHLPFDVGYMALELANWAKATSCMEIHHAG